MDALFERYKASFMSNRSSQPRNNNSMLEEQARNMANASGNVGNPYEHSAAAKNTFSGPLHVKNKLH